MQLDLKAVIRKDESRFVFRGGFFAEKQRRTFDATPQDRKGGIYKYYKGACKKPREIYQLALDKAGDNAPALLYILR